MGRKDGKATGLERVCAGQATVMRHGRDTGATRTRHRNDGCATGARRTRDATTGLSDAGGGGVAGHGLQWHRRGAVGKGDQLKLPSLKGRGRRWVRASARSNGLIPRCERPARHRAALAANPPLAPPFQGGEQEGQSSAVPIRNTTSAMRLSGASMPCRAPNRAITPLRASASVGRPARRSAWIELIESAGPLR